MVTGGSQYAVDGRSHYARNKAHYSQKAIARKTVIQKLLRERKDRPCMDCGGKYPYYVMDLDHRDPSTKTISPAAMVNHGWCTERVVAEMDKCDVVCSNCHRERTHKSRARSV